MEKIDKEKILEMLCSEDIELRRLGISILEQNYEIPYRVYYNFSYTGDSVFFLNCINLTMNSSIQKVYFLE